MKSRATAKDASEKDATEKDATEKDATEKDTTEKDTSVKTPLQKTPLSHESCRLLKADRRLRAEASCFIKAMVLLKLSSESCSLTEDVSTDGYFAS